MMMMMMTTTTTMMMIHSLTTFITVMLVLTTNIIPIVVSTNTDVQDSKILVHIPFQLHEANGFDHVKAGFGFGSILNDYQSISSYVYYINEVLCYPVTNSSVGHPVLPNGTVWQSPPFILLINGGGTCSHVTKVRNAQMMGASAVVLSQPHCSCADDNVGRNCTGAFPHDSGTGNCEDDEYIRTVLINDGSAADISIPSFYMMKLDGENLKRTLRANQPVLMELQWGRTDMFMNDDSTPASKGPVVDIQFWSVAYDPHVQIETYNDIRTITTAFSEYHINFVPRYSVLDGQRFNCYGMAADDSPCDHLCTNNGKYCTNHGKDLTGRAIIIETVRRACIYEHSIQQQQNKDVGNKHDLYWDYVLYHKKECSKEPDKFADPQCYEEAMKHAKIDIKSITACINNSGGTDDVDDAKNTILESALTDQHDLGIVTIPALVFNKHILHRGGVSAYALFDVICNEYWMSNVRVVPDICVKCSSCPNTVGCVKNGGKCVGFSNNDRYIMPDTDSGNPEQKTKKKKKKSHFWSILGWMLFFGCAFGAAYYYYETHIKDARRSGSRPLMNDYLHLNVDG